MDNTMSGYEVLAHALRLMGYTGPHGDAEPEASGELLTRGTAAVAQVFDDLQRIENNGRVAHSMPAMDQPLPLAAETARDVMPYGVAMFLAQGESDGDSQQLYASMYNQKRASVPRAPERRRNVIPGGGY